MGADMHAGDAEIWTRDGCSLVSNWCHRFDTRVFSDDEWRDRMGVYEFPAEVVRAANDAVPLDFGMAVAGGWINSDESQRHQRRQTTPESFREVRDFLAAAAKDPYGIRGGY